MRPRTPHFIVSTEDSFVVGGNFYNRDTYAQTLKCMVVEHYFGREMTNETYATAPIALFQKFSEYVDLLIQRSSNHGEAEGNDISREDIRNDDHGGLNTHSDDIPTFDELLSGLSSLSACI